MTTQTDYPGIGEACRALHRRCQTLLLPSWRCDADGELVLRPLGFGDAEPLLLHPLMDRHIADAARQMLDQRMPQVVALIPGFWLMPMIDLQRLRRVGIDLVLTVEPEALDSDAFEALCRTAELDPAAMRAAMIASMSGLDSRSRHDPRQLLTMLQWMRDDLARSEQDRQSIENFSDRLTQSYEEINLMYRLARSMKCLSDPRQMIQITCDELMGVMPFAWVAIVFAEHGKVVEQLAGRQVISGDLPIEPALFDVLAHRFLTKHSNDGWPHPVITHDGSLARAADSQIVAVPIHHGGDVVGALIAGGKTGPQADVTSEETKLMRASGDFLGMFHENGVAFAEQKTLFMGTLRALTASIDAKDEYTCGHSERVALLCRQIAEGMGMTRAEADNAHIAGLMHDVGKIGVPERVLGKPGRLTEEEFRLIKQHTLIGYRILSDIPQLRTALEGVLYHHERYDGRGYPEGLAGKRIPPLGRLIAIADAFDAMSSTRSYRQAIPRRRVLQEIRASAGTQLDPQMVEVFLALDLAEYDKLLQRHQDMAQHAA